MLQYCVERPPGQPPFCEFAVKHKAGHIDLSPVYGEFGPRGTCRHHDFEANIAGIAACRLLDCCCEIHGYTR